MAHHLQHHHQQPQYVHYTGPPGTQLHQQVINNTNAIANQQQQQPTAPTTQQQQSQQPQQPQQQQPQAGISGGSTPLVATGDWTKDLVHLAKTAELKKHALTLQLHTAHILSAHASLEQKGKAIQDIKEQKNKLESERTRLLQCLSQVNEDRDKADLLQTSIEKECHEIQQKITQLTEGDYSAAKRDVDRLRQELGQPPLPSLQSTLDEKSSQFLNERRLNGNDSQNSISSKRPATEVSSTLDPQPNAAKRPRGRPKGSKNRAKVQGGTSTPTSSSGNAAAASSAAGGTAPGNGV